MEASNAGIPLISKNKGLYKNVNHFKGNGYDEMSILEPVVDLLNRDAFLSENSLNASIEESSIFAYSKTFGNKNTPTLINITDKIIFLDFETLDPTNIDKPKPNAKNRDI